MQNWINTFILTERNFSGIKILPLTSLLFLIFSIKISAQFLEVKKPLTIDDGLSQNSIYAICQDSKGFIWFGTKDGLNRYDGYEFKIFKNDIRDKSSLSGNFVKAIVEDGNHNLWIGTGRGLSKYNLRTGRFEQNKLPEILKQTLENKHCVSLTIDRNNLLWIGTRKGVYSLSLINYEFIDYSSINHSLSALSTKYIYRVVTDSEGRIWFGTFSNGLFYFDPSSRKLSTLENQVNSPGCVSTILEVSAGKILSGAFKGGINIFSTKDNKSKWLDPDKYNYCAYVTQVIPYRGSEYIIACQNGIYIFNYSNYTFQKILDKTSTGIPSFISLDNSGNLWLGTDGNGIFKLNPKHKNFKTVKKNTPVRNGLSFASVRTFFMDHKNRLWVGGHGGLNKLDSSMGRKHNWEDIYAFKGNSIYAFVQDPVNSDKYWVGTEGGGLYKYDYLRGTKERYFGGNESYINFKRVNETYKILITSTNELYFATDVSLIYYNPSTEKFAEYIHHPDDTTSIVNRKYKAICEDNQGRIWIGSDRDGISILDKRSGEFQNFRANGSDFSLSANRINSFCESTDGTMWIGTENGLNKFIPAENRFRVFTSRDGLANDFIYGILEDNAGNLWLSTNKGISKFNPVSENITNFDVSYGLQSNEFNTVAYYKSPKGEIFFGGIYGFTSFFPEEILLNEFAPRVMITKFKKHNREFDLENSITYTDELELTYEDHFISFEFVSTDFTNPERVQYRFQLTGFDENWIYTDAANRSASYTNLDPGRYNLIINASNSDGVWSDNERRIAFIIHPAFWDTFWFKSLSLILILSILILLFLSRIKRLKMEKQIQSELSDKLIDSQEKERERISNALHDDLGQDLLVVSNKLMSARQNNSYESQVDESIQILSKSIENISNISHLLHPAELDLLGLTLALESMIELVRNSSGIKISSKLNSLDEYFSDEQRIYVFRIVQESLNNIIKHSNASEAGVYSTIEKKYLTITITDNGKGFIVEKDGSIKADRPHLGLPGIRERVSILKGRIKIDSAPGKGTTVILIFPINK